MLQLFYKQIFVFTMWRVIERPGPNKIYQLGRSLVLLLSCQYTNLTHFAPPDHCQLDAQVPATLSPGQSQRHPPTPLFHLQDLRFQGKHSIFTHLVSDHSSHFRRFNFHSSCSRAGEWIHWCDCLPERKDHSTQDRSQPLRQGLQRDGRLKEQQKVGFIRCRRPSFLVGGFGRTWQDLRIIKSKRKPVSLLQRTELFIRTSKIPWST